VSEITGAFTEQVVADKLVEAGYRSFPIQYGDSKPLIPRVKFELPVQLLTDQKDRVIGEADAMVIGDAESFSKLKIMCPVHMINDDRLNESGPKVLIVEVKATAGALVQKFTDFKKKDKLYWLLRDTGTADFVSKIVFVNGGEASKQFVLYGDKSKSSDDRYVWKTLKKEGVSIFYKQSFTQEWVVDIASTLEEQNTRLADHERKLADHERKLADHERKLADHERKLADHERKLANHERKLACHERKLADQDKALVAQGSKLKDQDKALLALANLEKTFANELQQQKEMIKELQKSLKLLQMKFNQT